MKETAKNYSCLVQSERARHAAGHKLFNELLVNYFWANVCRWKIVSYKVLVKGGGFPIRDP